MSNLSKTVIASQSVLYNADIPYNSGIPYAAGGLETSILRTQATGSNPSKNTAAYSPLDKNNA